MKNISKPSHRWCIRDLIKHNQLVGHITQDVCGIAQGPQAGFPVHSEEGRGAHGGTNPREEEILSGLNLPRLTI